MNALRPTTTAPWDLQWLRQVARDASAAAMPLRIAVVLTERMDGRTHETFVSQAKVADALGASIDGIRKGTKRLLDGGHLVLIRAGHGGRVEGSNVANRYRAILKSAAGNPQPIVGEIGDQSPDDRPEIPRHLAGNPQPIVGTIPLSDPLKISLDSIEGSSRKTARRSLPADRPNELDRTWALKRAADAGVVLDLNSEAERFRDHHDARATLSANWAASWRTWIGNAIRWDQERANRDPRRPGATDFASIVAQRRGYDAWEAVDMQVEVLGSGAAK